MSLGTVPWQVLIIVGVTLTSIGQAINKYQAHKASSLQASLYKTIISVALTTFYWKISNNVLPELWIWFLLYGLVAGVIVILNTMASRHNLSKTVLVSPAAQVFGIGVAALVLKEWQVFNLSSGSGRQMTLALILVPMMMYFFYERQAKEIRWSKLVLIVMVLLSINKLFAKYVLDHFEPIQLIMIQYWGALLVILGGNKAKKYRLYIDKKFALTGLIQGSFSSTATFLYYSGLKKSTISQVSLLQIPIYLTLTVLFGFFIFKEIKDMTTKKWLGMGVALLMAILVVTANH